MRKYILAAFVALAFAPAVSAQQWTIDAFIKGKYGNTAKLEFPRDFGVQLPEDKDFGYSKNVSKPFNDGIYYIKLESFATGTGAVKDLPSDIVLVLDVSGSMREDYGSGGNALYPFAAGSSAGGSNNNGFSYNSVNGKGYRYKVGDADYEVMGGTYRANRQDHYYLYFNDGTQNYYLDGDQVVTDRPQGPTNGNTALWWGPLWRNKHKARIDELKTAVNDFIDIIQDNDLYYTDKGGTKHRRKDKDGNDTNLGNKISIVKFASNNYYNSNHLVEGNHKGAGGNNNFNYTELVKNLSPVSTAAETKALKDAIDVLYEGGATAADYGLTIANEVLATINRESNKTVVFFTDGQPTYSSNFEDNVANNAVKQAEIAKSTYGATVFSVGVLTSDADKVGQYMNRVSSNYEGATAYNDGTEVSDEYYQNAADGSLADVFANIAKQAGGSSTTLSAASSNVDVVSNSFILPEGATASNIENYVKVFTAPLEEIDANGKYVFGTETMSGHATDTYNTYNMKGEVTGTYLVDEVPDPEHPGQTLRIKVEKVGTHGIKVTNFDYSNNWCGPIEDQAHQVTYHGHKIIILIPILMDENAVGGPNVETNGEGSGIYEKAGDTEAFVEFKSPTVSLPVNIFIEKTGLEGKESARFMIERAVLPASGKIEDIASNAWEYVTTVFVTNSDEHAKHTEDGNPVVKVRGLAANKSENEGYVYRVTEENWSWSYSPDETTYPSVQFTDTKHIQNPFTFDNEKKYRIDVLIRHAESKVKNVFKGGEGVETREYDDSKTN